VTRWVPHALGVVVVLVASAAGAPATALTAPAPVAVTPQVTPQVTSQVTYDDPRPLGDLVTTVLRLAGIRAGVEPGCDGVDWRQGVTLRLEPCQAVPRADTVALTGHDGGDRRDAGAAGSAGRSRPSAASRSSDGTVTSAGRTGPPEPRRDGNVAGGRPAEASSAVDGSPPGHAVDGTVDTAWRALGDREWWQVDLGRSTRLSAVILNWDAHALPTGYTLLLSKDGEKWARAGKAYGRPNGGPTVLELSAAEGRFVRVQTKPPVDRNAGLALRDVRVFAASAAAKGGDAPDPVVAGHVGRLPGTGSGALDGLADPGEGLVVPPSDPGALQQTSSSGFGPDPLMTAAMLVIVLAGVTGLVFGQTAKGGRHRQRGMAALRLAAQRLRELERMPRPGSPRSSGTPGTS
jgi:hypothetical protein